MSTIVLVKSRINPPAPHALVPSEEDILRQFRTLIAVIKLGDIGLSYKYSEPENDAIRAHVDVKHWQPMLVEPPTEAERGPQTKRIMQLIRDLDLLLADRETLAIDAGGFLPGVASMRHATLLEWYAALEKLGPERIYDKGQYKSGYYPIDIKIDLEVVKIRLLDLQDLRDRIEQLKVGNWPRIQQNGGLGPSLPRDASFDVDFRVQKIVSVALDAENNAYQLDEDVHPVVGARVNGQCKGARIGRYYDCSGEGLEVVPPDDESDD